jgi:hypothetical protein
MDVGWNLLPADVLEHHIFSVMPLMSAVVMKLVSRQCRNIASRVIRYRKGDQKATFLSLYKDGASANLLDWFQESLRFPLWSSAFKDRDRAWFALAAEGNFEYYNFLQSSEFS